MFNLTFPFIIAGALLACAELLGLAVTSPAFVTSSFLLLILLGLVIALAAAVPSYYYEFTFIIAFSSSLRVVLALALFASFYVSVIPSFLAFLAGYGVAVFVETDEVVV